MRKKVPAFIIALVCFFSIHATAQVTFGTIDPGPYGRGSSISIPLVIPANSSLFTATNQFTLFISGPNGDFSQETQIGAYQGFFSTFINGIIPVNLAAGSYKLRVKSSSPANIYTFPQDIQVLAVQGPAVGATPPSNLIIGNDAYGWCGSAVANNKSITLKDNSTAPTIQRLTLKNELTGAVQEYQKSATGYVLNNLPQAYYTITVTGESFAAGSVIKSSRSYLLLNSLSNVSVSGNGYGCIDPQTTNGALVMYNVDIQESGIRNNYPGITYRITWGDGGTDVYTHGSLIANGGILTHQYQKSSCGEPPIDIGNGNKITNAFKLTVTSINPFCQAVPASATTYPQIFTRPIAQIDPATSATACLNTPLVFSNTTKKGTNGDCSLNMIYEWYVDGVLLSNDEVLKYTFTTKGNHSIRLVAKNDLESCQPSEDTRVICIQEKPVPSFNFNGNTGATVCSPGNLKATNTSVIDNTCNPNNTFKWVVTGGTVTYANGTSAASKDPEFTFTTPGIYKVKLSVTTASCGEFSTPEQTVIVNGTPVTQLSPNIQLCNLGTYSFDNTTSGPTKTIHSGTQEDLADTYTWSVTGGAFSFVDGTLPSSKFPHINFTEYKTYTITVTHKNNCTSSTASQQISFIPAPVINAGPVQNICFEQNVTLNGTITGEVTTASWVGGLGTFTPNRNVLNAVYTPTDAERAAGKVELTLHATTTLADPCNVIDAYTTINIAPQINITSAASLATCKSLPLNYTVTSNVPGTAFTWTATGSANASGFQSGSGTTINDAINNSDPANNATVVYTITPTNGSCSGKAFTLTVTIAEIKNTISNSTPVVCSGETIGIAGNLPTGGNNTYMYYWESSADEATWTVIPNQTAKDLNLVVTETLSYRRIVASGDCSSTSNTVKITVLPPLSNNSIDSVPGICTGKTPASITGTTPLGGDGNYRYQWQSSMNNGATWTDLTGATLKDFNPPALTQSTSYRRLVSSLSCSGNLQSTSNTVQVRVYENAVASFTFTADKSCSPFLIDDQNIVAEPNADRNSTFTWYADNKVIGTGLKFPGYTIVSDSTAVTIKLITESTFGCSSDTISHVFTTQQRTTASFIQDVTQSCGTTLVTFRNTTPVLNGSTYLWDFGNGNTSTSVNPAAQTYQPDASGKDTTYTVTLTVNSYCGNTTFSSSVLVKALPQSVFSPDKTTGCSPLLVTFSNTSPGTNNTYHYDFGDGTPILTTTSKTAVTHTFVSGGIKNFVVTMTTENDCGESEPTQYTVRVTPNTILPELVVNSTEKEGCAPLTVHFQNNSSGATSFVYDFGDGTTSGPTHSAPETVSHTFTSGGTFLVKLTASNGCSDTTTTETIVVYNQPVLKFSADVTTGCPGQLVKFKNESTDAVSYSWDFGDGTSSNEFEPQHVYSGTQEYYTVRLSAVNSLGCSDTLSTSQFIHIIPAPVARFNVLPAEQIGIPNYTFQFEDESLNTPNTWEWDFGDGQTSTSRSPGHTYADTGKYVVSLRVTNLQGCFTTISKTVQITGVPGYLYVPNAFMPESATPELRTFKAKGSGIESYTLSIFNKWGELLWQTNKLEDGQPAEGWDGTYKSSLLPQGVYFWKIDVQMINKIPWKGMSYNGSNPKRTGIINLIR